ncbi:MAG: YidH family protein [Halothiobacillus sp.]
MSDLNDPRVFFAAERTLMAWNRTGLTLMAFGFVIERFDLFVNMLVKMPTTSLDRGFSFWIGLAFIVLGAVSCAAAVLQYRTTLKTLRPIEIPAGYWVHMGAVINVLVALLGLALTVYLFHSHP